METFHYGTVIPYFVKQHFCHWYPGFLKVNLNFDFLNILSFKFCTHLRCIMPVGTKNQINIFIFINFTARQKPTQTSKQIIQNSAILVFYNVFCMYFSSHDSYQHIYRVIMIRVSIFNLCKMKTVGQKMLENLLDYYWMNGNLFGKEKKLVQRLTGRVRTREYMFGKCIVGYNSANHTSVS